MAKEQSEVIGTAPCLICGNVIEWKKSARGRITGVCKWQDSGCGSQVQGLTPDSCARLMQRISKKQAAPADDAGQDQGEGDSKPGLFGQLGGWL